MVITINGVKTLQIKNAKNGDFVLNLASAELVSIIAVYTQSGTVYADDSLDTLKSDLVVTARYDNGISKTVTDYELSGSLTTGTSTITVTYEGKTTTFNVQVSATDILYSLSQPTTFDGTSDYIDTGIQLMKEPKDFTIVTTFTPQSVNIQTVLHCKNEIKPWPGLMLDTTADTYLRVSARGSAQVQLTSNSLGANYGGNRFTAVIRSRKDSDNKASYTGFVYNHTTETFLSNHAIESWQPTGTFTSVEESLLIGCYKDTDGNPGRFFHGTIESFTVYDRIITDSEVLNESGMNYTPSTLAQRYSLPSETVFNGTSTYIDTNLAIMNDTKNYTIALTIDHTHLYYNSGATIVHCMHEVSPYPGLHLHVITNNILMAEANGDAIRETRTTNIAPVGTKQAVVMRIVKDSNRLYTVFDTRLDNNAEATKTVAGFSNYVPVTETMLLGAKRLADERLDRYWEGKLKDFKVYEGIMSDEDVEAYLQEAF